MQVMILHNTMAPDLRYVGSRDYQVSDHLKVVHVFTWDPGPIWAELHQDAQQLGQPTCYTMPRDDIRRCRPCDDFTRLLLARLFLACNSMTEDTLGYPEHLRSLSVGDVIALDGDTFAVTDDSFRKLAPVPMPCDTCGWRYDDDTLSLTVAGRCLPDLLPTHLCRPVTAAMGA